jgi:excisionase family DNA binding protein
MPDFVQFRELLPRCGIPWSRPTILRMVAEGKFPAPKPYGLRRTAWLKSDLDAWLAANVPA